MFRFLAEAPAANPLASGFLTIEGADQAVALIFAQSAHLMAPQLAPLLINAANSDKAVAQRLLGMGPNPKCSYSIEVPGQLVGSSVRFNCKIFQ